MTTEWRLPLRYLYGEYYYQQIKYINGKEKSLRINILDYYDVCMSEQYENFNYIKSLIEKNKSIGILSKISTDIITEEISKYIKKHEFTYKPDTTTLNNIWYVNSFDFKQFHTNKILQQFPEYSKYLTLDLDCSDKYDQNSISMIQEYRKSPEYKTDRRARIDFTKENKNINHIKLIYFKNKKELTNILDNFIHLEDTLNKFATCSDTNDYLIITYKNDTNEYDNNIYQLEFNKCKKIVKVYKKTNWKYDNDRKPIYSFKPFPYRTPPKKLENLLYINVYMNKFSLSGHFSEICIEYMEEYKKRDLYNDYHLYEED